MAAQAQQPVHFFDGVGGNVNVHDGQFVGVVNNVNSSAKPVTGIPWFDFLLSHCAPDALFDSKARQDLSKCIPHTREAIQKEILDWINLHTQSGLVMWLNGSAGAGKSAIAQTIAELLNSQKTPTASFFFSRVSGSATRVDGDRLLPTIVYQLCLLLPEYQAMVKKKLKRDPTVFERSYGAQMAALLTQPLQQFSFRRMIREMHGNRPVPLVIIIDGLDECRDPQIQCDLLRVIADAATSIRRRPVRFFIASRPETHITRIFDQHPNYRTSLLRRINLDNDPDASMAILAFIRQEIQKIHETHPLRIHLEPSWPGQEIIDFLVLKSSPQFILASTAMLYVGSPKHHPAEQLSTVIAVLNTPTWSSADKPLERMDMLYTFIFNGIGRDRRDIVQAILGIIHLSSLAEYTLPPPTATFLETTLSLSPGYVHMYLEPLVSVIHLPVDGQQPVKSMHASLYDFLLNATRSGDLALDLAYARAGLIGYCFRQDLHMLNSLLLDRAVQSVWFTPIMIKAALIFQQDYGATALQGFQKNQDFLEEAQLFFILLEFGSKLLDGYSSREHSLRGSNLDFRDHLLPQPWVALTSPTSPTYQIKHIYKLRCCDLRQDDLQGLIDIFRNPNTNRHSLFRLLIYYVDAHLFMANDWQIEIFEEVGRKLHEGAEIMPTFEDLEVSDSREETTDARKCRLKADIARETRDLVNELVTNVLQWFQKASSVRPSQEQDIHRVKQIWEQISFRDDFSV